MATYTVEKGDTLSAIAKKYGTTYQQIAKDNGISNPNLIYAGQTLEIGSNALIQEVVWSMTEEGNDMGRITEETAREILKEYGIEV